MGANPRTNRIGEAIKAEISDILQNELKDPRVGFASIVKVEVSNDLRHTKVYVSVLGGDEEKRRTLEGLNSAKGFIRGEIGRRIRLRHAPEISFQLDESIEQGIRISRLINEIVKGGGRAPDEGAATRDSVDNPEQ